MRLLHSQTLQFTDLTDDNTLPKYAILSHRWGDEEVTYEDMRGEVTAATKKKKGYHKIRACAAQARRDGFDYIWIDTCCIDKSSSAELTEAINRMFRWYRESAVCYAFLGDVPSLPQKTSGISLFATPRWKNEFFKKSVWFTRGWTLQELLAPRSVVFYSRDWMRVGTRASLALEISAVTGIPARVLTTGRLEGTSAAQRMSWAAGRRTARTEDVAYSLMGLFGVYMPMLYGEGEHAFLRLQQEIIRSSDDLSIFSWVDPHASPIAYRGLLARSPADFADCRDHSWRRSHSALCDITNKGIRMALQLVPRGQSGHQFAAVLPDVWRRDDRTARDPLPVVVHLKRVGEDQYARIDSHQRVGAEKEDVENLGQIPWTTVFVRQSVAIEGVHLDSSRADHIRVVRHHSYPWYVALPPLEVWPSQYWDEDTRTFKSGVTHRSGDADSPMKPVTFLSRRTAGRIVFTVNPGKALEQIIQVDSARTEIVREYPISSTCSDNDVHCHGHFHWLRSLTGRGIEWKMETRLKFDHKSGVLFIELCIAE
ncbi:heterokaryon incompatibility protein-domain-containing protein [Echria macrotheca]|uniref:Heterokaryon incompatibility protein-domain-containing protein n=1 Tax=Echria macrotheca TaxID=438768 RepID=A0AAJ0BA95_9PEZI|nr:heterokaryon incompatibility protein-domain-containing protein [Echria macrotheca]